MHKEGGEGITDMVIIIAPGFIPIITLMLLLVSEQVITGTMAVIIIVLITDFTGLLCHTLVSVLCCYLVAIAAFMQGHIHITITAVFTILRYQVADTRQSNHQPVHEYQNFRVTHRP